MAKLQDKERILKASKEKQEVTRGEEREGLRGGGLEKGQDHQGLCIKDPWTKPKGRRIESGSGGRWGGRKWWQEKGVEHNYKGERWQCISTYQ